MIRLRELREDHDLTQEQCAVNANISKKTYERYENQLRRVPDDIIIYFAKFYNVSADYILGLIDEPRPLK